METRIGLFSKTFSGDTFDSILMNTQKLGCNCLHINWQIIGLETFPEELPEDKVLYLQKELSKQGISIASISCTYNMIHADEAIRTSGRKGVLAAAKISHLLGNPLLSLCSGSFHPQDKWAYHPKNKSLEAWEAFRRELDLLLEIAQSHKVRLGIEPEYGNVIFNTERALALMEAYQGAPICIIFDLANLVTKDPRKESETVIEEDLVQLLPFTEIVHIKDRNQQMEAVCPGLGVLPLSRYIERVKELGFEGAYICHGLSKDDLPFFQQWISQHF